MVVEEALLKEFLVVLGVHRPAEGVVVGVVPQKGNSEVLGGPLRSKS